MPSQEQGASNGQSGRRGGGNAGTGGANHGRHNGGAGQGSIQQAKYINMMLCRAAEHGNVQGLLNLVASKQAEMTCVNFSTAMHKLARLAKENDRAINARDGRLVLLHARIRAVLEEQLAAGPNVEIVPRCWATISWAYGTLQLRDPTVVKVLEAIGQLSLPHLDSFNPLELTNLLWGFAKLQVSCARLFQMSCHFITSHLSSFSLSNLSTLVWAYVTAQQVRSGLINQVAQEFVSRLATAEVNPVELANLMWGLATAKLHPKGNVLSEVGSRALVMLPQFKLQELSITAWAFSRLNARHDAFFAGVAQHLYRSKTLRQQIHAQGIANLLWSFERQKAMGCSAVQQLMLALRSLLPVCLQLLPELKPQEFTCVTRALTKLGLTWGMLPEADELFIHAAGVGGPLLRRLSLSQRADVLEGFAGFLGGGGPVPEVCSAFVAALLHTCFDKESEFESLGSLRVVEVAAAATLLLGEARQHFVGIVANFALQVPLDKLSVSGIKHLADMCDVANEADLASVHAALLQRARAPSASWPEPPRPPAWAAPPAPPRAGGCHQAQADYFEIASTASAGSDERQGFTQPTPMGDWCVDEFPQSADAWGAPSLPQQAAPPLRSYGQAGAPREPSEIFTTLPSQLNAASSCNFSQPTSLGPQQPPQEPLQRQADHALLAARSLAVQALLEGAQDAPRNAHAQRAAIQDGGWGQPPQESHWGQPQESHWGPPQESNWGQPQESNWGPPQHAPNIPQQRGRDYPAPGGMTHAGQLEQRQAFGMNMYIDPPEDRPCAGQDYPAEPHRGGRYLKPEHFLTGGPFAEEARGGLEGQLQQPPLGGAAPQLPGAAPLQARGVPGGCGLQPPPHGLPLMERGPYPGQGCFPEEASPEFSPPVFSRPPPPPPPAAPGLPSAAAPGLPPVPMEAPPEFSPPVFSRPPPPAPLEAPAQGGGQMQPLPAMGRSNYVVKNTFVEPAEAGPARLFAGHFRSEQPRRPPQPPPGVEEEGPEELGAARRGGMGQPRDSDNLLQMVSKFAKPGEAPGKLDAAQLLAALRGPDAMVQQQRPPFSASSGPCGTDAYPGARSGFSPITIPGAAGSRPSYGGYLPPGEAPAPQEWAEQPPPRGAPPFPPEPWQRGLPAEAPAPQEWAEQPPPRGPAPFPPEPWQRGREDFDDGMARLLAESSGNGVQDPEQCGPRLHAMAFATSDSFAGDAVRKVDPEQCGPRLQASAFTTSDSLREFVHMSSPNYRFHHSNMDAEAPMAQDQFQDLMHAPILQQEERMAQSPAVEAARRQASGLGSDQSMLSTVREAVEAAGRRASHPCSDRGMLSAVREALGAVRVGSSAYSSDQSRRNSTREAAEVVGLGASAFATDQSRRSSREAVEVVGLGASAFASDHSRRNSREAIRLAASAFASDQQSQRSSREAVRLAASAFASDQQSRRSSREAMESVRVGASAFTSDQSRRSSGEAVEARPLEASAFSSDLSRRSSAREASDANPSGTSVVPSAFNSDHSREDPSDFAQQMDREAASTSLPPNPFGSDHSLGESNGRPTQGASYIVKNTFIEPADEEGGRSNGQSFARKFFSDLPRRSVEGSSPGSGPQASDSGGRPSPSSRKEHMEGIRELLPASLLADLRAQASRMNPKSSPAERPPVPEAPPPPLLGAAEGGACSDGLPSVQELPGDLSPLGVMLDPSNGEAAGPPYTAQPAEAAHAEDEPAYIVRRVSVEGVEAGGVQVQ